ncbi:hypothetical protein EJ04DRAFT_593120 [Polyplosphaeria fusca]|uniref:Uncharacterized protein n=1 Tax=Polyplosphaeria fusca TaxID=682080 RepID=A0A9P4V5Q1_9PLEO|nr:hypothetical protein EJ04DRAFT_593120 [Polyplosphaeria fusca]
MASSAPDKTFDPPIEIDADIIEEAISNLPSEHSEITQKDWEDLQRDCCPLFAYTDYLYGPETRPEILERRNRVVQDHDLSHGGTIYQEGQTPRFTAHIEAQITNVHKIAMQGFVYKGLAHPQTHHPTTPVHTPAPAPIETLSVAAPSLTLRSEALWYWDSLSAQATDELWETGRLALLALQKRRSLPNTDYGHIEATNWLNHFTADLNSLPEKSKAIHTTIINDVINAIIKQSTEGDGLEGLDSAGYEHGNAQAPELGLLLQKSIL